MGTNIQREQWYRLTRILKFDTSYRLIIGERSNGKTYALKEYVIDKYKRNEGKFMYIRRRHEQVTRKLMTKLFDDINDKFMDEYGRFVDYTVETGFFLNTSGKKPDIEERETVGYVASVEDCYALKGIPYNEITTIFFDEFLEYGSPIEDEIPKFMHLISTIVRKRENVEIFMIANTVTKFSEYFNLMGIDPKKLKMGEIAYLKHESGVSCAIEYCSSKNIIDGIKQKNKYLGFDNNPTSDMILYGEWEYDAVNTSNIDGIGWNSTRRIIPMYLTALGQVYEMSVLVTKNPIAFVRIINTQKGFVKTAVKYNLSYDNSLVLTNKEGVVASYGKISKLMDDQTLNVFNMFKEAMNAKRIVFDKMSTGSDFLKIIKRLI